MSLRAQIHDWVGRLTLPRAEFAGLPACPFAGVAIIGICHCEDVKDARGVLQVMAGLRPRSVLVLALPDGAGEDARAMIAATAEELAERDLLALVSDPGRPVVIAGFRTTQAARLLIIVQRKAELEHASRAIAQRGYYRNWEPGLLEDIR